MMRSHFCYISSNVLGTVFASFLRFIAVLLLFGCEVHCDEVGHGKHKLVGDKIELKGNTLIAENKKDLERYIIKPGACNVTMDDDKNNKF